MIKTEAPVLREPKQERSRRSFERVQDAALALLVERGPDAFTLAEVCTRADASMGAIYNRVNGKDYPRYFFTQVSDDIRGLFCEACRRLGIHYTQNNWKTISIARSGSVARLDEFVGPKV